MKKIFLALVVTMVLSSVSANAGGKFGVTGGLGFNTAKFTELGGDTKTGWNVGITGAFDLPLGFSIQPSLVYNEKTMDIAESVSQSMGYLELPVSLQWGPDLLIFRPFVDVTPYVGYALTNDLKSDFAGLVSFNDGSWEGKNRLEYGLGVGGGLDVWKFRLVARYNWNFGPLYDVKGWDDIKDTLNLKELNAENPNFGGVTLTLSFFF
jgi:hypothetical protein